MSELNHYEKRYLDLVDQRDAVNAQVAPLQEQLDAANEKVNAAQAEALALAAQIDELRGREKWIELKKEIALLSRALPKLPVRETVAA